MYFRTRKLCDNPRFCRKERFSLRGYPTFAFPSAASDNKLWISWKIKTMAKNIWISFCTSNLMNFLTVSLLLFRELELTIAAFISSYNQGTLVALPPCYAHKYPNNAQTPIQWESIIENDSNTTGGTHYRSNYCVKKWFIIVHAFVKRCTCTRALPAFPAKMEK